MFVGVWFWTRGRFVISRGIVVGCFVEGVCWFPTEAVEAMWWLGLCERGGREVYRERLRYDVGPLSLNGRILYVVYSLVR